MVPNSLSEETPSKEVGHTKNFFRGETSRQRYPTISHQKHLPPSESEGEEELTPVSNRFQSLEDMESDDILQLIESTKKSTSLAKNSEAGGSKPETQDHRSGENTHQEMILTDSPLHIDTKGTNHLKRTCPKHLKREKKVKRTKVTFLLNSSLDGRRGPPPPHLHIFNDYDAYLERERDR
ncbi:UNVERIFIED_CONTAM: hypothetical protein Slati_1517100 [Sesamum latifolium]|uniref:Uncharacterized protein n=1 Tax=Sesamum latifolium TaxID=2727402 RepID=A0AAW2X615_9LAMI